MQRERSVLILGAHSPHMGRLADRVRDLGHRTIRVKTAEEAINLARERGLEYGVGFFEPAGLAYNLAEALDAIRARTNSPDLCYIATGSAPDEADRDFLRQAGIKRALWSPVEDHALRFQLNAGLSSACEESLRCEIRAPIDARAIVRTGGRVKQVSIYCLSPGGAFLETPRPSMPGADIELAFRTPEGELSLPARVLYTNVPGNLSQTRLPLGMAIRFDDLERSVSASVRQLVESNAAVLAI